MKYIAEGTAEILSTNQGMRFRIRKKKLKCNKNFNLQRPRKCGYGKLPIMSRSEF